MEISIELVKALRERTGAGVVDCKEALKATDGDSEKAYEFLRKKGVDRAQNKTGRSASEGIIYSYIHQGGKIGVLLELNCETDFVARTEDFQGLAKDIAMHIAAMNPLALKKEDLSPEVVNKEREIYASQLKDTDKPQAIKDKIIEGKIEKFYKDVCLLEQAFIKDDKVTIGKLIMEKIAKLGENIILSRFTRFQLGENKK